MVMPIQYDYLEINDIKIKNSKYEKRFFGEYIIVEGSCKVTPDEEETFEMDFIYEGKHNEPSSKLLNYLKESGWYTYREMNYRKPDTLMDFINKH